MSGGLFLCCRGGGRYTQGGRNFDVMRRYFFHFVHAGFAFFVPGRNFQVAEQGAERKCRDICRARLKAVGDQFDASEIFIGAMLFELS